MKIKTITDEEILSLIESGRIVVKYLHRRDPIVYKDGKALAATLVYGSRDGTSPRYRVEICLPKKTKRHKRQRKRTIVRSKIVWMFARRSIVPDGHELHHRDEDRLNDRAKNIIDWTEEEHRNYHNGSDSRSTAHHESTDGVPF